MDRSPGATRHGFVGSGRVIAAATVVLVTGVMTAEVSAQAVSVTELSPTMGGVRVDILRDGPFSLDGSGTNLGMFESGRPLANHFVFGTDGQAPPPSRVTVHPTIPGNQTAHAAAVGGIMVGQFWAGSGNRPDMHGVASGANLFNANRGTGFHTAIPWLAENASVINTSHTTGNIPGSTLFAETFAYRDVLWVKSAGNSGPSGGSITVPGEGYNILTVGALGANSSGSNSTDYTRVVNFSSRGPVSGGRSKPEIVAPGANMQVAQSSSPTAWSTGSGTSYAAPLVSGTVGLLEQWADRQDLEVSPMLHRATLINSASRHVRDPRRTDSAGREMTWVMSPAATFSESNGVYSSSQPFDHAMGAGALNAHAAVRQMHPDASREDIGRRADSVNPGDTRTYRLFEGRELAPGALVNGTLAWMREVTLDDPANPGSSGSYTVRPIANLDLELVRSDTGEVVARSNSGVDNTEHMYFNVRDRAPYELRVRHAGGGGSAPPAEDFALSWTTGSSDGPSFSVASGAHGLDAPLTGNSFPNDVNALGTRGPANLRTQGEIFSSSMDGTNMMRLSGAMATRSRVGPFNAPPAAMAELYEDERGVLGLRPGDNVNALSWGRDTTWTDGGEQASTVAFSLSGSGDVLRTMALPAFGIEQHAAQSAEPLGPSMSGSSETWRTAQDFGLRAQGDDMNAFTSTSPLDFVDPDGDGMPNERVFFTLSQDSTSIGGDVRASSILTAAPRDPSSEFNDFQIEPTSMYEVDVFAPHTLLGIDVDMSITGLVLSHASGAATAVPGIDTALFTLSGPGIDEGAIFWTDFDRGFDPLLSWDEGGSLFASSEDLGLAMGESINALGLFPVPAPGTLGVLALAGFAAFRRRRSIGSVRSGG